MVHSAVGCLSKDLLITAVKFWVVGGPGNVSGKWGKVIEIKESLLCQKLISPALIYVLLSTSLITSLLFYLYWWYIMMKEYCPLFLLTYMAISVVQCDVFGRFFMCLTWRSTDLDFLATHIKILIYKKRGGEPTKLNEEPANPPVLPLGSGWGPYTINMKENRSATIFPCWMRFLWWVFCCLFCRIMN